MKQSPSALALNLAIDHAKKEDIKKPFSTDEFDSVLQDFIKNEGGLTLSMIRANLGPKSEYKGVYFHPLLYAMWCYGHFRILQAQGSALSVVYNYHLSHSAKYVLQELMKLSNPDDFCSSNKGHGRLAYQILYFNLDQLFIETKASSNPEFFDQNTVNANFFFKFFCNKHIQVPTHYTIKVNRAPKPEKLRGVALAIYKLAGLESTSLDLFKEIINCFQGFQLDFFVTRWKKDDPEISTSLRYEKSHFLFLKFIGDVPSIESCYMSSNISENKRIVIRYCEDLIRGAESDRRLEVYLEICTKWETLILRTHFPGHFNEILVLLKTLGLEYFDITVIPDFLHRYTQRTETVTHHQIEASMSHGIFSQGILPPIEYAFTNFAETEMHITPLNTHQGFVGMSFFPRVESDLPSMVDPNNTDVVSLPQKRSLDFETSHSTSPNKHVRRSDSETESDNGDDMSCSNFSLVTGRKY